MRKLLVVIVSITFMFNSFAWDSPLAAHSRIVESHLAASLFQSFNNAYYDLFYDLSGSARPYFVDNLETYLDHLDQTSIAIDNEESIFIQLGKTGRNDVTILEGENKNENIIRVKMKVSDFFQKENTHLLSKYFDKTIVSDEAVDFFETKVKCSELSISLLINKKTGKLVSTSHKAVCNRFSLNN